MRKFKQNFQLSQKPFGALLRTEILWRSENADSHRFPTNMQTICTRKHSPDPKPLDAFRDAFRSAIERVWIVDEYFLIPNKKAPPEGRIQTILEWLHPQLDASDIRILTKNHAEINQELLRLLANQQERINASQPRRAKKCSIRVNTNLTKKFNYVHDRFAIVDEELWHFGATVGGFHPDINSASRGWSAEDSGAIEFFELAWKECER